MSYNPKRAARPSFADQLRLLEANPPRIQDHAALLQTLKGLVATGADADAPLPHTASQNIQMRLARLTKRGPALTRDSSARSASYLNVQDPGLQALLRKLSGAPGAFFSSAQARPILARLRALAAQKGEGLAVEDALTIIQTTAGRVAGRKRAYGTLPMDPGAVPVRVPGLPVGVEVRKQVRPGSRWTTYLVGKNGMAVGLVSKGEATRTDTLPYMAYAGVGNDRKLIGAFWHKDESWDLIQKEQAAGLSGGPAHPSFKGGLAEAVRFVLTTVG